MRLFVKQQVGKGNKVMAVNKNRILSCKPGFIPRPTAVSGFRYVESWGPATCI